MVIQELSMPPTFQPQFLPETDAAELEPFRVSGPVAIKALLRDLIVRRALIALYARNRFEEFVVTQLVRFDDRNIELDFVTDQNRQNAMLSGAGGIVIGFLDTIKVQFEVDELRIVDSAHGPVLRCSMPDEVFRIQRRDAFRVRPLASEPVTCQVRDHVGGETGYRVIDFSVTGFSLSVAPGETLPEEGASLRHCRIEIGRRIAIPCDVVVRHVSTGLLSENGAHRVGCEFQHLSSEAERSLQLAVMDIEKRSRAAPVR